MQKEFIHYLSGSFSRFAGADLPIIDLHDGQRALAGTGNKHLLGYKQLIQTDIPNNNFHFPLCQLKNRLAGNPAQNKISGSN